VLKQSTEFDVGRIFSTTTQFRVKGSLVTEAPTGMCP